MYVALTWASTDLTASWRRHREIVSFAATALVALLSWCAWRQTGYWKNSEALWTHTLAVTSDNSVAHNNLGLLRMQEGRADDAIAHYQEALKIRSERAETSNNPGNALIYNNLGNAMLHKGLPDRAIPYYNRALAIRPDYADGHYNLGCALLKKGELDEAIAHYEKTLAIHPDDAETRTTLGNVLIQQGRLRDALAQFQSAVQVNPHSVLMLNNLAWFLATCPDPALRDPAKALELAQKADRISAERPFILHTLATAYAATGHSAKAIEAAEHALELAQKQNETKLVQQLRAEIDAYRSKRK